MKTPNLLGSSRLISVIAETTPLLTQQQLTDVTSRECDLRVGFLFDEIEKAAHSITKLLLGISR